MPWAQGGGTSLDNLVVVCSHHHERLHEGVFRGERLADGALQFFTPDKQVSSGGLLLPISKATDGRW